MAMRQACRMDTLITAATDIITIIAMAGAMEVANIMAGVIVVDTAAAIIMVDTTKQLVLGY